MDSFAGFENLSPLCLEGMPEVYLTQDPQWGRIYLKIFRGQGRTGEETLRINRDLEILSTIEHVRILAVRGKGSVGSDLWYTVDAPDVPCLETEIENRILKGGSPFPLDEVLQLAIGLGEAMGYLHEQKLVHGRLSGSNILIHPVLGLILREPSPGHSTGMASSGDVSVLRYASPEQVQLEQVEASSDVYQTGLLLYHLLTGSLPLEDENAFQTVLRRMQEDMPPPSRRRADIPPEVDQILLKCLKPNPQDRYPDMSSFLEEVLRLDPQSGQLLPGQAMPGDQKPEQDPLMGLIIPKENKPKPTPTSVVSAVIPGVLAGLLLVAGIFYLLN